MTAVCGLMLLYLKIIPHNEVYRFVFGTNTALALDQYLEKYPELRYWNWYRERSWINVSLIKNNNVIVILNCISLKVSSYIATCIWTTFNI